MEGVVAALWVRFGLTPWEARSRLLGLRREYRSSLQEHSTKVLQLAHLAYDQFDAGQREDMALEMFTTTLGHSTLQRRLLAARPQTIEEAVRMSNEYIQVYTRSVRLGVAMCDNEELEDEESEAEAVALTDLEQLTRSLDK